MLVKLAVFVIGTPTALRSACLRSSLPNSTQFVPPVFVSQIHKCFPRFLQFLLNGRALTAGELGCAEAHMNARSLALTEGSEWNLILEDDANFTDQHFSTLSLILRDLDPSSPEIVLFQAEDSPQRSLGGVELVTWRPAGAVAACYSRAALRMMRGDFWMNEVADYPSVFRKANFWIASSPSVGGVENSTIGTRPVTRVRYGLSLMMRLFAAPLLAPLAGMSLSEFVSWYIGRVLRSTTRTGKLRKQAN